MDSEYSQENANFKHNEPEEQSTIGDDLKFMRSAVEKTYRPVKPDVRIMIAWGLICLITYTAIHFMAASNLYKWIPSVCWPLVAIGLCYTGVTNY